MPPSAIGGVGTAAASPPAPVPPLLRRPPAADEGPARPTSLPHGCDERLCGRVSWSGRTPATVLETEEPPAEQEVLPRSPDGIRTRATALRGRSGYRWQCKGSPRSYFVAWRRHSRDEFGPVGWPRPRVGM